MGNVWFAPEGAEPPSVDPSAWVKVGYTDSSKLGFSFDPDASFDANRDVLTSTLRYEFEIARTFDVPLEFLGFPVRADYAVPRGAVDIEWKSPTIGRAPVKAPGLTGRRYRIARRAYARKRRVWVRAGSPLVQNRVRLVNPKVAIEAAP